MNAAACGASLPVRISSWDGQSWQGRVIHAQSSDEIAVHGLTDVTAFIEAQLTCPGIPAEEDPEGDSAFDQDHNGSPVEPSEH